MPVVTIEIESGPTIRATVDASRPEGPLVTEVTVAAQNGSGLGTIPDIDLRALAVAFGPGREPAPLETSSASKSKPRKRAAAPETGPSEADTSGRRPYRRMPDPAEVLSVYEQAGSVAGLADHFKVPAHTARSWLASIRRQGEGTPGSGE
jgi:hypothetical protein